MRCDDACDVARGDAAGELADAVPASIVMWLAVMIHVGVACCHHVDDRAIKHQMLVSILFLVD